MPVEFLHETGDNSKDYKLLMAYDGSGRRISKTRYSKNVQYGYWTQDVVTHYTGIGTEVREAMRRSASPKTTVVVNLPQGLGRYLPEDAEKAAGTAIPLDKDGKPVFMGEATPEFEWYLKNHLGSTMLVYGTQPYNDKYSSYAGGVKAAYDYRAFGEQVDLTEPTDKVTENFTGKERDDETELNYFGARYLDPMLGMWTSVDPKRQFSSPYLYAGNGMNPVNGVDPDGNVIDMTYNTKNGFTTVVDRNQSRNPRPEGISFDSYSGHQPDPNEFGGPIPKGKYLIVPDPNHENWFRLLAEDGKINDVIDYGGDFNEGIGRDGFRFHRYNDGTDGCVSADVVDVNLYKSLVNWIKGTETYTVKDANNQDLTVYGELKVNDENP